MAERPLHHQTMTSHKIVVTEQADLHHFKKIAVGDVKSPIEGHWHEFSAVSSEIISSQPESDQPIRQSTPGAT